jgi:hypothetical protein
MELTVVRQNMMYFIAFQHIDSFLGKDYEVSSYAAAIAK